MHGCLYFRAALHVASEKRVLHDAAAPLAPHSQTVSAAVEMPTLRKTLFF